MGAARCADDDAVTVIRCFLLVKLLGEIRLISGRSIFSAWGFKELGAARRCVSKIGWLSVGPVPLDGWNGGAMFSLADWSTGKQERESPAGKTLI